MVSQLLGRRGPLREQTRRQPAGSYSHKSMQESKKNTGKAKTNFMVICAKRKSEKLNQIKSVEIEKWQMTDEMLTRKKTLAVEKSSVLAFAFVVWMPTSVAIVKVQAAIKRSWELVMLMRILHRWWCSTNEERYIWSVYRRSTKPLNVRQKRRWRIGLKGPPIETSKAGRDCEVETVVAPRPRLGCCDWDQMVCKKWKLLLHFLMVFIR